jgi:hypothetical protein
MILDGEFSDRPQPHHVDVLTRNAVSATCTIRIDIRLASVEAQALWQCAAFRLRGGEAAKKVAHVRNEALQ